MSTSSPAQVRSVSGRRSLFIAAWVIGAGLVVTLFSFVVVATTGLVFGEELSRDDLQIRSFRYYEIPFLRLQVSGIVRAAVPNPVIDHVIKQKWITPKQASPQNWDLVRGNRGSRRSHGDASILSSYLSAPGRTEQFWLEWSKQHADLAAVLWPEVYFAVQEQNYYVLPELFRAAEIAPSPDELKQAIAQQMSRSFLQLASIQKQLGNAQLAAEMYANVLRYDPQNGVAVEALEKTPN